MFEPPPSPSPLLYCLEKHCVTQRICFNETDNIDGIGELEDHCKLFSKKLPFPVLPVYKQIQ